MNMIFSKKLIAGFTVLAVVGGFFAQLSIPQTVLAADTISTAQYLDNDGDGTVDRIRWTMDENVTACTYEAGDWTVNSASEMTLVITSLSCTGSDAILDILVSADTDETGATTDPVISYADAGTTGSVTLTSGDMAAHASVTVSDGAAPVIYRMNYNENSSGYIDDYILYFTETLDATSSMSPNNLIFTNVGDFTGLAFGTSTTNMTSASVNTGEVFFGTFSTVVDTNEGSGNIAFSTQGTFTLTDGTNTYNTAEAQGGVTFYDAAKPVIKNSKYEDSDGDGKIDQVVITFSEIINATSFLAPIAIQFENVGDFTGAAFGSATTPTGTTSATYTAPLGTESSVVDTYDDSGNFEISFDPLYADWIRDANANSLYETAPSTTTVTDGARPVVVSVGPDDGATGLHPGTAISMRFSEDMDGTFVEGSEYSLSPDPGVFTLSDPGASYELAHPLLACNTTYTVTTTEANINAANGSSTALLTTGPEDGDWSFTTGCFGSSSSSGSAVPYYEIDVTGPGFGDVYVPGDDMVITWDDSSTTYQGYVNLYFSADQGATHELIVKNAANNGSYTWTAPHIDTEGGTILVQLTDMVEIIAEDYSLGYFTIEYSVDHGNVSDVVTAPTTGDQGISPVTGELEDISEVNDGSYIRSVYFDTVYYVDADMMRHPFMDRQTYFTWQESFDSIEVVTDATLMTLPLGAPMLPKPAVTLVKIQSATRVYAVVDSGDMFSPILRAISDEEAASLVYGGNWADYVIDLSVTLFPRFQFGDWIYGTGDITVDKSLMKTRESIN